MFKNSKNAPNKFVHLDYGLQPQKWSKIVGFALELKRVFTSSKPTLNCLNPHFISD